MTRSLRAVAFAVLALAAAVICGCSASPGAAAGPGAMRHPAARSATTGFVLHWGSLFGARTGNFDTVTAPVTVRLPAAVREIGTSNSTQYALLVNGSLYAWGMGNAGQLGDGHTANSFDHPVRVRFPAGVRIAWIPSDVMPFDTGLAVDTDGQVWGWGRNGGGELCTGSVRSYLTPVRVPLPPVSAAAGASNHAVYDASGTVYACGQNSEGDLGDGSFRSSAIAMPVTGLNGRDVTALVASFANSGALLSDGRYVDWGYNAAGQLGDGRAGGRSDVPVQAQLPDPAVQVAQGGSLWNNGQTLALLSDGAVWSWGNDRACQLGNHKFGYRSEPGLVQLPAGVRIRSVATGSATSYALSQTGTVYSWGVSHVGQLGTGRTATRCTPEPVTSRAALISATANNVLVSLSGRPAPIRNPAGVAAAGR